MSTECQCKLRQLRDRRTEAKNRFEKFLVSKISGRSILIWGAVEKNNFFLEFAKNNDIEVSGYIDSYAETARYNDYPVWKPADIFPSGQYIFVGLKTLYEDVIKRMFDWGLNQYEDYIYWFKPDLTLTCCNGLYEDFYGNEIIGNVTGFSVQLGYLSRLQIGKNCKIDNTVRIVLGQNAVLEIGDDCVLRGGTYIRVKGNSLVHIGNNCILREFSDIRCDNESIFFISANNRFGERFRVACNNGFIYIHSDCVFSKDILLQGSDGHPLYDLQRMCRINDSQKYRIEIGKHVWIGKRCSIRYGAKIGSGSVIGMESFVHNEVPNNVIAAGNPLRIIRENVAWSRTECPDSNKYFEEYDFRTC